MKHNDWFSNQIIHLLKRGKDPANTKMLSKLPHLKTLHAVCIVNLHNNMQGECETNVKGFKKASFVEAIRDSEATYERVKNPFRSWNVFFVDCINIIFVWRKKDERQSWCFSHVISCKNLFYNPCLTSLHFLFWLFRKTELFLHKKEIRIND